MHKEEKYIVLGYKDIYVDVNNARFCVIRLRKKENVCRMNKRNIVLGYKDIYIEINI